MREKQIVWPPLLPGMNDRLVLIPSSASHWKASPRERMVPSEWRKGNTRVAVICCAIPSESNLEKTRSTLLFANVMAGKQYAKIRKGVKDRGLSTPLLIARLEEILSAEKQGEGNSSSIKFVKDTRLWRHSRFLLLKSKSSTSSE